MGPDAAWIWDDEEIMNNLNSKKRLQPLYILGILGDFIFGADKDQGLFFNGKLDEIAIWNRALSLYEIQNLYSVPNQPAFEKPANHTYWVSPYIGKLSCIVSEPYSFEEPVVTKVDINGTLHDRVLTGQGNGYGRLRETSHSGEHDGVDGRPQTDEG